MENVNELSLEKAAVEAEEREEHEEEGSTVAEIVKIVLAGGLFAASFFTRGAVNTLLLVIAYLIVGGEVIISAVKELFTEFSIDEEFLMSIATVGAWAIGEGTEAVAVMLFYAVGELLEDIACDRSRKSVTALLALRPDTVAIRRNGAVETVPLEDVREGDVALFSPGERIALDGIIISGETMVDNSALTGESVPEAKKPGDTVFGGGINSLGAIEVRITKPYAESSTKRILDLVENARDKKAKTERFITKFAKKYTIAVVLLAAIIAFVCPAFTGYRETFSGWFYRGLTLLVVSCPCAFVISVPLAFFAGIGCASRNGILIKGAASMEQLAKLNAAALDKTGTVTKGELSVSGISGSPDTLSLAAAAEARSTHPIAKAIISAYGGTPPEAESISEEAGKGVTAIVSGDRITVGRGSSKGSALCVEVRKNGEPVGEITLKDDLKPDSREAILGLKNAGVSRVVMLSGDRAESAGEIARSAGIDDVRAELTPEGKCSELEKIQAECGVTCFVGDGINDAPVLGQADIGVAMGGLGSDAAIETADVVILDDKLTKLPAAVKISRKTMRIAYQCVWFALLTKAAVIVLEIAGIGGMWPAVFADVGVTLICILNSLRALAYKPLKK